MAKPHNLTVNIDAKLGPELQQLVDELKLDKLRADYVDACAVVDAAGYVWPGHVDAAARAFDVRQRAARALVAALAAAPVRADVVRPD